MKDLLFVLNAKLPDGINPRRNNFLELITPAYATMQLHPILFKPKFD